MISQRFEPQRQEIITEGSLVHDIGRQRWRSKPSELASEQDPSVVGDPPSTQRRPSLGAEMISERVLGAYNLMI